MNVIRRLTWQNIKRNPKRTVATVLAIIMSAALICGTAGIAFSGLGSLKEMAIREVGDFHQTYLNVPANEVELVTKNPHVKSAFFSKDLGYALLEGSREEEKPYVFIRALDDAALSGGFAVELLEGRLPENEQELVVTLTTKTVGGVTFTVGQEVTLSVGERERDDGRILRQNDAFFSGEEVWWEDEKPHTETLVNTVRRTYTVVGIMARPDRAIEGYEAPGFTCYTKLDADREAGERLNVSVHYDRPAKYADWHSEIAGQMAVPPETFINFDLLEYSGALSSHTVQFLLLVSAIVVSIIMVTSVFVIRNSFAISVAEKRRLYGTLVSVGATKKQIRSAVLWEGLFYGLIGVPVGVLAGVGAIALLLKIVSAILSSVTDGLVFSYHLSPWVLLVAAVLSALTIFFSSLLPAERAAKTPSIALVRGEGEVKVPKNGYRVSRLTEKLFGVGGVLAAKNLKRARRKYRTTVVSLALSAAVFISLSSFIGMAKEGLGRVRVDLSYDMVLSAPEADAESGASEEKLLALAAAANAERRSVPARVGFFDADIEEFGSASAKAETKEWLDEMEADPDAAEYLDLYREMAKVITLEVVTLNDEAFDQYLQSLAQKTGLSVVLRDPLQKTVIRPGMRVPLKNSELESEFTLTVDAVAGANQPMGLDGRQGGDPVFFLRESAAAEQGLRGRADQLFLKAADPDKAEDAVTAAIAGDPAYAGYAVNNLSSDADADRRVILVAEIFLYGFITVITLIGVTNVFNTVTTNMLLRSREFAVLRSVGMTKKEFDRMIRLESLMYGMKSLLLGVPLGLVGSVLIYLPFRDEFGLTYRLPVVPVLLAAVFVFLIVFLTMGYSLSKIKKQNIIETIRRDTV